MRIDPKYFNRFMGICAFITAIVIIYSTIRYSQRQVADFEKNAFAMMPDILSFRSFSDPDSLHLNQIGDRPVIIHFWSTWSEKSNTVNELLHTYSENHENLVIIAAAVRDSDEKVKDYISGHPYPFQFVEGTQLYHSLMAPGIPTQLFISKEKELVDTHVGNKISTIQKKLDHLMNRE